MIITLSSGKIVRGLYGTSSFSSSDEQFRDIYLQEVYMQKVKVCGRKLIEVMAYGLALRKLV